MKKDNCDLCGSTENIPLFDGDHNADKVNNVICTNCGLIYLSSGKEDHGLNADDAERALPIAAREPLFPAKEILVQSDNVAWTRFNIFIDLLKEKPTGKMLEIGCGLGSYLRYMQGLGMDVVGIASDPMDAAFGTDYNHVPIVTNHYADMIWPDQAFDLIASFLVLDQVLSPKAFLRKVKKELKSDGYLFLEVPCIEYPNAGNPDSFFWKAREYNFSKNTLIALLHQIGFEMIADQYSGNFLWIVAKNSQEMQNDRIKVPFDDPKKIYLKINRIYKKVLIQNAPITMNNYFQKMYHSKMDRFVKLASKLNHKPSYLISAVSKRIKNLASVLIKSVYIIIITLFQPKRTVLAHFGVQGPGNAGDVMLLVAIRKLFDASINPFDWILKHVYHQVTPDVVAELNNHTQGMVIGGGGILLPDTNRNLNSGWSWDCPTQSLSSIKGPMIAFAIGFNLFRDQEDFSPIFAENIRELVKRSIFFGMRNHGSIRQLSLYLDESLHGKLIYQPCPTTILKYLYPQSAYTKQPHLIKKIALNIAFDRRELRFGKTENEILGHIAKAMKWANENEWEIYLVSHVYNDNRIIPWLLREKVAFTEVSLFSASDKEILAFYKEIGLSIGMRGHSQMIPFGLGTPIISIVSHNKLNYFLEDINHLEWGLDIKELDFGEKLISKIRYIEDHWDTVLSEINIAQEKLWKITNDNMQYIQQKLRTERIIHE